jgi:hypothetical protein
MQQADRTQAQVTLSGRALALMRRQAMALHGKAGVTKAKTSAMTSAATSRPAAQTTAAPMAASPSTVLSAPTATAMAPGRQVAMQRRLVRSLVGRQDVHSPAAAPSGRMRARNETAAVPSKVEQAHAPSGRTVTGTMVDSTHKVTGTGVGACHGITGTEYLAREHFESVCRTTPPTAPRKVSVMSTLAGQRVSGSDVDRAAKVTGGDRGRSNAVTGTEYLSGPLQPVGGSSAPVAPVAKVGLDQTWRGQAITGSQVGRSSRVTGDEPGGCAAISGTPYIGRGNYKAFCDAPQLEAQQAHLRTEAVIPAAAVTGDRPGAGGSMMTGDARGACGPVSGTPYIGRDNAPANCPPGSGRFVARPQPADAAPATPAPQDFSIWPPSRQAQERERATQAVTGSAFSNQRITGPVNKAGGLITGTPEFRHSEAAPTPAPPADAATGAGRLTGEGSQAGRPISGDAWQASSRVTGTEGASSLGRNPSQRGSPRGMGMNAQQFRDVERAAPAESRITGSSGSTVKGAAVTLSGGARG